MSQNHLNNADYSAPLSTLEIHLDAVARNYLFLKKKLAPGADCGAVVKADAYGLGAAQVSRALYNQGCRHFFVAHFDEGAIVRAALPMADAVIYVFNGPFGAKWEDFTAQRLLPVLNTLSDIEYWADYSKVSGGKKPALIHIDTGMNRLGLSGAEVRVLAERKATLAALDIRYVMSHLACADEPEHPKNGEQLDFFRSLSGKLGGVFRYSLANSAGIFLSPDFHFDLVRPGCALYGINPHPALSNPMQGVVTLKARILQIRIIDRPGTVGYGAHYKISSPAKCAVLSVGDRKSTRLNSSHSDRSRMPSSA